MTGGIDILKIEIAYLADYLDTLPGTNIKVALLKELLFKISGGADRQILLDTVKRSFAEQAFQRFVFKSIEKHLSPQRIDSVGRIYPGKIGKSYGGRTPKALARGESSND